MKERKIKFSFFKITKIRLLLIVIFFAAIVYLAGNPVDILGGEVSIGRLFSVIILVLLELLLSYIITCIVAFLFHKHWRR